MYRLLQNALLALCGLLLTSFAHAQSMTFSTGSSLGWFRSDSLHIAGHLNYVAGTLPQLGDPSIYRSFFSFDLSSLNVTNQIVTSATLDVQIGISDSPASMLQFGLFDVSESPIALNAGYAIGDPTGLSIYNDLGTGINYGSFTVTTGQPFSTIIHLSLNSNGLDAIRNSAGNSFSIGGAVTNLPNDSLDHYLFASTGGIIDQTLTVNLTTVPESGSAALLLSGMMGASFALRRRKPLFSGE